MRIVQISDLHYAPGAVSDRMLEQAERSIGRLNPDLILVSGDLSRAGLVEQFLPVLGFLERLDIRRVRAIPGNRDYPATRPTMPRPVDSDLQYFLAAPDTTEVEHEAQGVSMGWTPFTEFFPGVDVYERFPELTLVALDSEPRIPEESFEQALAYYRGSSPAVPRLFCTHRSLLPVPGKRLKEGDLLPNAGELLARLMEVDVEIAVCAHLHRVNVWRLGDASHNMAVVNAPSLLDATGGKVNGFLTIDIGHDVTVTLHDLDDERPRELLRQRRRNRRPAKAR
ncbi:MAG: hypothetical protein DCC58_09370 [Chloroflexi bacterium]|nr:MAG: hypothetical protein DCC58_09370 [Chloroflexota bacterium]